MELLAPSYLGYIIWLLYLLGVISREEASYIWPYIVITSVIGLIIIMCAYVYPIKMKKSMYYSVFSVPPIKDFPQYTLPVAIIAAFIKLAALLYYPRSSKLKYIIYSTIFLGLYILLANYIFVQNMP